MSVRSEETTTTWAYAEERGTFALFRVMFWALRIAGRPVLLPVVRVIVLYFFVFGRAARAASRDYLRRVSAAFPELGLRADWRTSYRHFAAFGDAILDKLDAWSGQLTHADVIFEDPALMKSVEQSHRGALIIGSHLGNLEVCRAIGEVTHRRKLNVLAYTRHAAKINRMFEIAGASGFELIQVTDLDLDVALKLRQRIEAGEWVVIAGDRAPVHGGRTVPTKLLGEQVPLPLGPYVLANLLGCPVYLMFCLRRANRCHVYLELFADRIGWQRPARDAVIAEYARKFAARLEHYIQLEPLQWFNFYRFWNASPDA